VERTANRPVRTPNETAVFEPQWLVSHQDDLHLSARQVQELVRLDASYRRVTTVLAQKKEAAQTDVTRFLDEAQKHKAVASSQLQEKMAELGQVQQDITGTETRFRKAARDLLTREQQTAAEGR
jgi:hypothetical protein